MTEDATMSLEYLLTRALGEGFDIRQTYVGVYEVGVVFKGWDKGTFILAGRGDSPHEALKQAWERCQLDVHKLTKNL